MTFRSTLLRSLPCFVALLTVLAGGNLLIAQDGIFDEPLVTGETGPDPLADDSLAGDSELGTPQVDPQAEIIQRMEEAQALLEQGNWTGALAIYSQLEARGVRDAVLSLNQGICYRELGQLELAISSFAAAEFGPRAAQLPGFRERVNLLRGQSYFDVGRYREAYDDFLNAVQANPTSAETNYQLGRTQLRQVVLSPGRGMDPSGQATLRQAAKSLEQAITWRNDFGDAYLERGRALFYLGEIDDAIADFQQAVQLLGPTSDAAAELGVTQALRATQENYRANPNVSGIVQDLRDALASFSSNLSGARLGEQPSMWEVRDPLEAQTRPERIMLSRADAQIALGNELTGSDREQQYRAGLADADELLRHDVDDQDAGRAYYIRGSALRLLGDLDGAIAAFTSAIRLLEGAAINAGDVYLRRGICYYYQNKLDLALQDFRMASTVPNNPLNYEPRAMMWAGIVQAQQGDITDAIRSYTRSIAAAPRYVPAYLNRGLAYMNSGRLDKAIEDFNMILRQQPNHVEAQRYRDLASQQL